MLTGVLWSYAPKNVSVNWAIRLLIASKSALCHKMIFLGLDLLCDIEVRDIIETISWSLIPGMTSQDSTNEG